jgi:precorrin-2 dehydrogenase / sirohydrochlorin ferrochelatase
VAGRKLESLLDAGADVDVIAPAAAPPARALAADNRIRLHLRPYRPGDLDGAFLAVAATDAPATNARVAADADAAGVLCVRADGDGSAAFMAALRRGAFTLAVSTAGMAPALARRVRQQLEADYGPEYGELCEILGELRASPAAAALAPEQRRAVWRRILDTDILTLLRNGQRETAKEVASACLSSSSD